MDCKKELTDRIGKPMTIDAFWKEYGEIIKDRTDEALSDTDYDDDQRDEEENYQRDQIVEHDNIKFTDGEP